MMASSDDRILTFDRDESLDRLEEDGYAEGKKKDAIEESA